MTMTNLIKKKAMTLLEALKTMGYGTFDTITREELLFVLHNYDLQYPTWFCNDAKFKEGRGIYSLKKLREAVEDDVQDQVYEVPANTSELPATAVQMAAKAVTPPASVAEPSFIPEKAKGYVSFGNFNDVRNIVSSKMFYPVYVTGLSGNGKTMMIEQVCAVEHRECIRVNVTIETDEDDLLGGFRLQDGKTVWHDGPAVLAMERGAILLLDEIDLGSNKLMCLQPILEGNGVFLKKIGKKIMPKAGFNIIATANTKGQGSDDGKFIGTNVMNEAFLERFSVTIEQSYPPIKTEQKILANIMKKNGSLNQQFVELLVNWADVIRKSFAEGAVSEIISTRRLVHIVEAYHIFGGNSMKAINMCLNRFDADTKKSFMDLYDKLNPVNAPNQNTQQAPNISAQEVSF